MGDRYFLDVICPRCGHRDEDVYYAPTCGFTEYRCPCGWLIDLGEYTGISYEDASNAAEISALIESQEPTT